MKAQRLRVTFARGDELKYITHLDMMRFWERALRRAGMPIAYSEGFSPHAQIQLAAPLAVGVTSDAELMDVFMAEVVTPRALIDSVSKQLPAGVEIKRIEEVGLSLPALQADVRYAEYIVDVPYAGPGEARERRPGEEGPDATPAVSPVTSAEELAIAVQLFLAAETISWQHKREDEVRTYDIRALVESIEIVEARDDGARLRMLLKNDSSGSGRPEQVAAALGLPAPARVHRTRLVLSGKSPAIEAYKKRGRFEG